MKSKQNEMLSVDQRYNSIFASRLREILEKTNTSQIKLAKAIGKTPQIVNHYCNGTNVPQLSVLIEIAQELNTTPDYLLGFTNNESVHHEVRNISDYTGLSTESIDTLHKYRQIPLFIDIVNFLFKDLQFLESIADYLTTPFLEAVNRPPYDHVSLTFPIHDKLTGLRAMDLHDNAVSALRAFTEINASNRVLQEYVADRYISKYSYESAANAIPGRSAGYNAHSFLYTITQAEAEQSRTEQDDFVESLDYFGIGDITYVKAIKIAEKKTTRDS